MQGSLKKVVQKQAYDILSHRYGILIVLAAIVIITVSAFHFGEAVLEWSHEKYAVVFNSYSDNLAGRSFRERLCLPVPIDIVYTWVNGTDPLLLNQLRHFKHSMESELNVSREEKCVFPNCLTTNMVILDPSLPPDMTLTMLSEEYPVFSKATSMKEVSSHLDNKIRYTVIYFSSDDEVKESLSTHLMINQLNTTIKRGFITSDWTIHNSILMSDIIMMSGFPYKLTEEDIKQKLQEKYTRGIDKVELYSEKGVAVLHMSDKEVINQILMVGNITIDGKEPTFNAANLVWDLRDFSRDDDISASRFEDNQELRYSLRSVEKFAPWVRHVYIITNGQIPHWLNLESPRVTVVTHSDLFLNKSHLPTFSSPAIESHIHRIPGLSQKFIYMNDDVMFGTEVWPDDFYSHSTGQKVYLTWPVPNCNEGCPSSWIKDGYCDKACNNTECEWDGGDCSGDNSRPGVGNWGSAGLYAVSEQQYCNKGCANSWLADRYCDTSCNVPACGFDVGDCGTSNYNKLHQLDLLKNTSHYTLPPGEIMGYFNLSSLLSNKGSVNSASYRKSDVIRVATVAQKFKVMTFILYPGHNATVLTFQLKYHLQNVSNMLTINFTLSVDTKLKKVENTTADTVAVDKKNKTVNNDTQDLAETYVVYDVPEDKQFPHIRSSDYGIVEPLPANINMSTYTLPQHLNEEFNSLLQELHEGELTEKGFNIRQTVLWKKYKEFLVSGGKVQRNTTAKILTGQSDGHKNVEPQGHQEQRPGNRKLLEYINIPVLEIEKKKTKNMFNHISGIRERMNKSDLIQEAEFAELLKKSSHLFPEGHFPWERNGNIFTQIIKEKDKQEKEAKYKTSPQKGRKLLDTFGDSLRHVNRIYNKAFGYSARKVPGHMPHMIDKLIMQELQDRFPKEWEVTSSNKMRSSDDMQFAFSYFYYLMGVTKNVSAADVFDEMDTDSSRVLSDREIRTLATRLYDLPLDLQTLTGLERILMNCSEHLSQEEQAEYPPPPVEHYYDQGMPQITRNLFIKCPGMIKLVSSNFKPRQVYRHVEIDDAEIAFKMLKGNISTVVGQLDDVRKHPKKFICLNDNIDHNKDEAKTVKAILQDFYESVFPTPSQFELSRDYRNRFLHTDELREWRRYRDWLKFWTHLALAVLIIFTVASFFAEKIEALQKRYQRRMRSSSEKSNKEQDKDATSSSSRTKDGAVMIV